MKKPLILTISLAAAVAVVCVSIGGYRIYKNANTRVEVSPVSAVSDSIVGKIIPLTA